jgi:hypothetical protein
MDEINITSAQYIAVEGENSVIKAIIDGKIANIPLDPANRHYAEIMRQSEAGSLTIQPAE